MIIKFKTDRERFKAYLAEKERLANWHSWFAWHPVIEDGFIAWLSTIERKYEPNMLADYVYRYRLPTPELTPGEEFIKAYAKKKRKSHK